jgi:hypothetical protein
MSGRMKADVSPAEAYPLAAGDRLNDRIRSEAPPKERRRLRVQRYASLPGRA